MADVDILTTTDTSVVGSGLRHAIAVTPQSAGPLSVRTTLSDPHAHPDGTAIGGLLLLRPHSATPVARATIAPGQAEADLAYSVTEADLATSGPWTCVVENFALQELTFTTTVTYPGPTLVDRTATFDLGLLNLVMAQLVRDIGLSAHLGSEQFAVFVSPDVLDLLKLSGTCVLRIDVPEIHLPGADLRVQEMRVDLAPTINAFVIAGPDGWPAVYVAADLRVTDPIVVTGAPLGIDVTFDVNDLSASGTLSFAGNLDVTPYASIEVHVGPVSADVSSWINNLGPSQLAAAFAAAVPPDTVRAAVDSLFQKLMRLDAKAVIRGYAVDGDALTVTYAVPGVPIGPPVVGGVAHGGFGKEQQ